jgi:hypothetical protein
MDSSVSPTHGDQEGTARNGHFDCTFYHPNFLFNQFNLSDASQTWLNDIAALMNNRPRKTLDWKTPAEAMAEEMAAFN